MKYKIKAIKARKQAKAGKQRHPSRKSRDTHHVVIFRQISSTISYSNQAEHDLSYRYAHTQKPTCILTRHALLPLHLPVCAARLPVWQGFPHCL